MHLPLNIQPNSHLGVHDPSRRLGSCYLNRTRVAAPSEGPTVVFAMHVNGFNVNAAPTATSSSSGNTTSSTSSGTSAPASQTFSPLATSGANDSGSLSNVAAAGIGVGIVLAFIAAVIGAWIVVRRLRKKRETQRNTPAIRHDGI